MKGRTTALFASLLIAHTTYSPPQVIDEFESVAGWKAAPSDGVSLSISTDAGRHGKAMRLDFDFQGHGGYAVVHKAFNIALPANYEFSFSIRGDAPVNNLEFKLIDSTDDNVWWSNQRNFVFPRDWKTVTRKKRHITFAWGPIGGGEIRHVAAIEFAITAGSGGKGTVWIDDLAVTPLEPEGPYTLTPYLSASSSETAHPPTLAMDTKEATSWRSAANSTPQSFDIDFLKRREFGGMVIDWEPGRRPPSYTVIGSKDAAAWDTLYTDRGEAARDYLFLPESDERYVRILIPAGSTVAIREIRIAPLGWSASENDFFAAIAKEAPPGSYPKYFSGEQSYWTVLGVSGDARKALINEQGMLEVGKGEFSIEPFVFAGNRLSTWHDVTTSVASVNNDLPIKTVSWKSPAFEMDITAFAANPPDSSVLYARYSVRNPTGVPQRLTLYLVLRPFQVNPPWQFLNTQGGVARIDSLHYFGGAFRVNADRAVVSLAPPSAVGATTFDEGDIVSALRQGHVPASTSVRDHTGHASAVLAYDFRSPPGRESIVDIAVPLNKTVLPKGLLPVDYKSSATQVTRELALTEAQWNNKLGSVEIDLPPSAARITETLRAQLAYILINRDGPAIQPGSRSYDRSWIRDGSMISNALLRLGHFTEVRDFINWYSKYQFANGKIPCCVDSRGADPVPENDSPGEFIYLIAEYYRHTGDRTLLERLWPNVSRAWTFMDSLRESRMTPEYQQPAKRVFYGLLPQSISHEGYSAKPMHSYWDDFFALRGFKDAAEIARILSKPQAAHYAAVRDEFRRDFYASIKLSMSQHHIDYIPGAAELGDFDATSTTIAVAPVDELGRVPQPALERTFDKYWENFIARRDGRMQWDAYTPYELRVVGTFVRMGDKTHAHEALDFFFLGQRPKEWRQWAEVVYRDPKTPKFIGDMPHTWVGSDYIRSVLDMFAYEQESDSSLVIGAGVLPAWVTEGNGVRVRNLSTHYGRLSYTMRGSSSSVEIHIEGPRVPVGGLIVRSPFASAIRAATLDGRPTSSRTDEVIVHSLPASLALRY